MRLGQIGHHFADCTFKCIFLYWKDPVNIFTIINTGSGNGLAPNKWQAITWVTYLEWGIGVFPQFLLVASQMADLPTNLSGLSTSWPELPFSPWSVEDFLPEIYNPRYNPDYLNQWWPSSRAWMNYDPIRRHIYVSLIISVWTQRHKLLWTDRHSWEMLCIFWRKILTIWWRFYCWLILEAGITLCMGSANERRRYNVTSSLTGWTHAQNDPCEVQFCSKSSLVWVVAQCWDRR